MRTTLVSVALAAMGSALALGVIAGPAGAAPTNSKNAFAGMAMCDNGQSYSAGFVGPSASFFLVDSTSKFVMKIFTEIFPDGTSKTFNYGIKGFDSKSLLTCSYTDPQGVFNIFQGFLTPRS